MLLRWPSGELRVSPSSAGVCRPTPLVARRRGWDSGRHADALRDDGGNGALRPHGPGGPGVRRGRARGAGRGPGVLREPRGAGRTRARAVRRRTAGGHGPGLRAAAVDDPGGGQRDGGPGRLRSARRAGGLAAGAGARRRVGAGRRPARAVRVRVARRRGAVRCAARRDGDRAREPPAVGRAGARRSARRARLRHRPRRRVVRRGDVVGARPVTGPTESRRSGPRSGHERRCGSRRPEGHPLSRRCGALRLGEGPVRMGRSRPPSRLRDVRVGDGGLRRAELGLPALARRARRPARAGVPHDRARGRSRDPAAVAATTLTSSGGGRRTTSCLSRRRWSVTAGSAR